MDIPKCIPPASSTEWLKQKPHISYFVTPLFLLKIKSGTMPTLLARILSINEKNNKNGKDNQTKRH